MCRAHIALQVIQAIAMMLHRIAACISGKVVALHLDNGTAKAYLCNQGGTVSPFLSRLACQILSDWQAWYYSYFSIHSYPPQCGGQLSVLGSDASGVASSPSGGSGSFLPLGPSRGGPAGIFSSYSVPALLHLGISTTCGGLGIECLQPSLDISGKLCVSSSCISSSGSVQVSGRTCQRSIQTFDSGGTMLNEGSLAPHSSQHVDRCSLAVPYHKRSCCGCLSRPGTQGSAISAFNPLAAQWCVLHRQGFSFSVCQAVVGATQTSTSKVYQQCWKEWAGWCAQQGVPNNAISAPKLAIFWYIYLKLAWPGISLVYLVLLFLPFWSLIVFTRFLILSFQN